MTAEQTNTTDVVVIGGGMVGLCTAMLLAHDGHHVTVLERDPAPPPPDGDAWDAWERRGVNQFRLLHFVLARFRSLAEAELPGLVPALLDGGASLWDPIAQVPAEQTGGHREGDDRFVSVTARRPILEAATARLAAATPVVEIRRGVAVRALSTEPGPDGVPHVTGVVTDDGVQHLGLVVDAAGRRSALPDLLAEAGADRPIEIKDDCGLIYYGRHFAVGDDMPTPLASLLQQYETISILTLPCDQGTVGVGLVSSARDKAMRAFAKVDVWTRVLAAHPLAAPWAEGEPITPVQVMAGIEDRHRTFVIDGRPVATGVLAVGDAWACTNPTVGRGVSIGMLHAIALRDLLREVPVSDPRALALRWHELTHERVEPLVQDTLAFDRHRLAQIDASLEGRPYETDDPSYGLTQALAASASRDHDMYRHFLDVLSLNARGVEVFGRPGVFEKAIELGAPNPLPGPDREELLALIGTAAPTG